MAILSNGKFYGFLCSVKATGRKLSNGVKEYVEDFVSGFAGHGWKLWEYIKGKWKLEIDSLVVRETMVVFELLIQKIRAVKGALGITQACGRIKTATLDESGQNWLVTIEDEMSFVAHDFIRCQDWTNGTLKGYWVEISEIRKIDGVDTIVIPVSDFTGGIGYTDGMEAVDPALSGMTTPAIGDEIVQFGNSKDVNRQSAIYLHADEGGQPAIDILFGINSKSFAGCTKIRMGGELPGTDGLKGFYCENGMIKGTDSTGHVVYCIYPDGTAEFGDGSAKFATDKSGYIAGGAISWHWDASKNKYVCSMKGVVLTWDNLDEETKENLKGEPGKDGLSITWKGDLSSAPSNPEKNWAYRNTSNGIVYIYNGSAWELMVADGQDGTDGTDGTDGLSVFITYHDSEDEPSRPTGSGTSGGWHTNATKDVVWISQKVASSASSGTWGDPIRFKGLPGKYTELRYKYAFGKPATPTGTNPAGWSLSPDREDITFSYSGDFTKDGDYYVSPSPTSHSSTYKQRISFTTRRANQMIHIEIDVSSEQNYDKGIVEALDTSYHMDNEHAWVGSGVASAVVDIAVPASGSHFVEIVYTKDGSGSSNEDRVKFRMLDPTTCWYSTAVIDGETTPSWSEPVIFPTDSKTEEQVYLLAKSKRDVIDLPTSNEYVNEYIGDATEYSSSKFYSAGNIVKYNNVYKVAIQAHSGIAPTNEAYWEDVLWWVDNPRGASEIYPYEYTCERTLQDGKWGEYKNYRLFGHYGKDGEPGEPGTPGEDANLLPWVEDWNNNKTEIGGEYLISPKIFSGTKDSNGKLTGVALGRDCVTVDGEKKTGIFALDQDDLMLELDPLNKRYVFRGTNIIGSPNGQRVVISPDSKDIKIFDDSNKNVLRIDGASKDSLNDLFSQNIPTINVKNIPASVPSQEREYMVDITDPIYVTGNVALDGRFFGGYTSSSPNTIFVEIILKAYSDSSLQNIIYADYIYSKVVSYKTEHTFNDEKFTGFLVSGYNVLSLRLAMSYQYSHSFSINNMSITPVVNEYLSSLFANGISLGTSSKNLFSVMNRRVNGINSIQAILSDGTSGLRLDSNGLQSLRNGRWGMVPSIICYGRAYSTPSNAYIRRCKSYNGDIPTITRMSSTLGYLRMNIPSSWTADGFSESTVQIMLTGYGQSANGSASNMSEFLIKATVLSVTSSYVYIGLSDDDTGNDGEFYFEMKWL
jgi:hypothetical protein